MSGDPDKSSTISRRRALVEEVLEERSKVVAALPIEDQDPPPGSPLWPLGAHRIIGSTWVHPGRRRQAALEIAVLALAWLEAIDDEATVREASPGG